MEKLFLCMLMQMACVYCNSSLYTIKTRLGKIEGKEIIMNNSTVYQFKRIPYAKPPIGQLRFQKPHAYGKWEQTLNGTDFGPSCMQNIYENDKRLIPTLEISEDCLHLNIYVPNNISKTNNMTVMIWVHGGGLIDGQSSMADGSSLSLRGNVIVVTINYRLNVFGFMNTGQTSPCRGHFGFFDQQLAFKWVKENIEDYGGNPNAITIFGESAGSWSVTLQSVLPSNTGLFQRVIGQSGSFLMSMSDENKTVATAMETASLSNCSNSNIDTLLDCLRNLDASNLMNTYYKAFDNVHQGKFFGDGIPAGELFNRSLVEELQNNRSDPSRMFQSVDLLAGTNVGEAGRAFFFLAPYQRKWNFTLSEGIPNRILCDYLAPQVNESWFKTCDDISIAICDKYVRSNPLNSSLFTQTQEASNLLGDMTMHFPVFKLLVLHAQMTQKNTFQYSFAHKPRWELTQSKPDWLQGPNHASELAFVFGLDTWYPTNISIPDAERHLSHVFMDSWTNFAKTGDPNGESVPTWKKFTTSEKYFMKLDIPSSSEIFLYPERMSFLEKEVPNIIRECSKDESVLSTLGGKIRGKIESVDRKTVIQFRKIPYAKPPVGNLRFSKPEPVQQWSKILNCTVYGSSCVQFGKKIYI